MALADVGVERNWLLELDAIPNAVLSPESAAFGDGGFGEYAFGEDPTGDTGGVEKLLYSSNGFTSDPADILPSRFYEGRIGDDIHVVRRVMDRDNGIGGLTQCFAEVVLVNADGGLDTLPDSYFFDGRAAKLLVGEPGWARSAFDTVFTGLIRNVIVTNSQLRIVMADASVRLELASNRSAYAGTGGLEGGSDLKGKPKPKCWGSVNNVPCPMVDSTLLIYQVHDGSVNDITAVYDRQISLTKGADYATLADLLATAPSAGNFRVYKPGGYFRLGSTPAGTCTADAQGDNTGGYVTSTGDIVQRILVNEGLIDAVDIDAASFTALNTDAPAVVGYWTGTAVESIAQVVDRLLSGVGAFGGFSRLGKFNVGVLKAPTGRSVKSFDESQITELEREPLPAPLDPIVWRTRAAWQHNYMVMSDVAAGVTAARRTFAAEPDRISERSDSAILSRRKTAKEYGPTDNRYAVQADADTETTRLIALWGVQRGLFRVTLPVEALTVDIPDAVTLTHSRHGFSAGRQTRVLWHEVRNGSVILKVFV